MIGKIITFMMLLFVWAGLTGFKDYGILNLLVPALAFISAWQLKLLPQNNPFKINAILYFFWLLKEIWNSAIGVIKIACRQNLHIQPQLEPIKSIQKTDFGMVLYSNSITLTPGTVTLSTEDDAILVHALDLKFMNDLKEGEMDRRVNKIVKQFDA